MNKSNFIPRPDGMYLVECECLYCGEKFAKCALANYSPYCYACDYMLEQEREFDEWLRQPPTFWPYMEHR